MRPASLAQRSTPCAILLTLAVLGACGDPAGSDAPTTDVVLRYNDGITHYWLSTDSALFNIAPDSSFMARAYFPATASHPARVLTLSLDSLGGLAVTPAIYNLANGVPLPFDVEMRSATTIARPTSGTVTISNSTAGQISGALDIDFDYVYGGPAPGSFHLSGSFAVAASGAGLP
jgi:hypothetical protein